ncbi:hypothetical protein ACQCVP_00170 [Rossellomorea vietnamensis]|uniref:hypothetical protein n=1 Tax=Rossellomorea vietnamensis TaxID=218284 RepID=UPI003CF3F440
MFSREEKAVFPFILLGLFDPEGLSPFQWVRTLGRCSWTNQKRKRPDQSRQANVLKRKKGGLSFYSLWVI